MKYVLTVLCALLFSSGYCDMMGDVEYQLPNIAKDWVVANKDDNTNGTTVIYQPKNPKRVSKEFFGVNNNRFPSDINDQEALKKGITAVIPDMQVDLQVLQKGDNDVFYELSGKQNGKEVIHGWAHVFVTKEGTTLLIYETNDLANLPKIGSAWRQALQTAHIKKA